MTYSFMSLTVNFKGYILMRMTLIESEYLFLSCEISSISCSFSAPSYPLKLNTASSRGGDTCATRQGAGCSAAAAAAPLPLLLPS